MLFKLNHLKFLAKKEIGFFKIITFLGASRIEKSMSRCGDTIYKEFFRSLCEKSPYWVVDEDGEK